jgi:hypothetical protein
VGGVEVTDAAGVLAEVVGDALVVALVVPAVDDVVVAAATVSALGVSSLEQAVRASAASAAHAVQGARSRPDRPAFLGCVVIDPLPVARANA